MANHKVGEIRETRLHAALKAVYALPDDKLESLVDGFYIDVVKANGLLIEIQTGNFRSIRNKLSSLLRDYQIKVVYPVTAERWIQRVDQHGGSISYRKSPKKGLIIEVFKEITSIPGLLLHPNFLLEVVLIQEEQTWQDDGRGSWRRKHWSIVDRNLLGILSATSFNKSADYYDLLPKGLPQPFTTADLHKEMSKLAGFSTQKIPVGYISLIGKMVYTLREMGLIKQIGKQGRRNLYIVNCGGSNV